MVSDRPDVLVPWGSRDRFAALLAEIAIQAAPIALAYFRGGTQAAAKADGSPVTAADVDTQRFIVERLRAACPDLPICGEEEGMQDLEAAGAAYLLVDPLDGTKEFIKGSTEWTVNIGLILQGRPVAGAVSIPAESRVYWGGETAWTASFDPQAQLQDRRQIKVRSPDLTALKALCSRDHNGPEIDRLFERLGVTDRVAAGSSLKMLRIAGGEADLYPRLGPTMVWDTAAAHAVLRAAGGDLFTCDGHPLTYDREQLRNPNFIAYAGAHLPANVLTALRA